MGKDDDLYRVFKDVKNDSVTELTSVGIDSILPVDFKQKISKISDYMLSSSEFAEKKRNESEWSSKYYYETRLSKNDDNKPVENMENMENISIIKSLQDAVNSRHDAFFGTKSFNTDCNTNANSVIDKFIQEEENDVNKLKNYMYSYVESYKSLFSYKSSLSAIINEKLAELKKLQNKLDTYKQNLYMDNRKDSYQRKNYDFYKNIHFFLLIVYYSLFVLYLIFSNFFSEKKYTDKKILIIISIYILLPLVLKYILQFTYKSYNYFLEYFNLRDKIISYPYIISDKEYISDNESKSD
tara:strand:+ start:5249 stop:6139 length:891 start_codon:yes stop_codon:yes gene_type:complete